jgi:hypothetical protein
MRLERVRPEKEFDEITSIVCYCKPEGIYFVIALDIEDL